MGAEEPMSDAAVLTDAKPRRAARWLRRLVLAFVWLVLALLSLWALAALYIDVRLPAMRLTLAILYAIVLVAIVAKYKLLARSILLCLACFCLVLIWWFSLKPTNTADWQADVDRPAWVERHGDQLIIHNLRNCDYRTETATSNCL